MSPPSIFVDDHDIVIARPGRDPVTFPIDASVTTQERTAIAAELRGALADAFHAGRKEALAGAAAAIEVLRSAQPMERPKRPVKPGTRKGTMRG